MRREFPSKVKLAAFERAKGHCEKCGAKIIGAAQVDHVIPDALGGEPTLDNAECLCKTCHAFKTGKHDVPRIAKTKRQRAKHIGAVKTRAVMPGSKTSKFKKHVDGRVTYRV